MRPPRAFAPVWPAIACVTIACWVVFAPGCGHSIFDVLGDVLHGSDKTPPPDPYTALNRIAWWCLVGAVAFVLATVTVSSLVPSPRLIRWAGRMAGACVACAVGAWVLELCLEQLHFYLPWAVALCALCGLATLGLYVYGHRKVFRKRLGV